MTLHSAKDAWHGKQLLVETSSVADGVVAHGRAIPPSARLARRVFFFDQALTETMLKVARDGTVFVGVTGASSAARGGFLRSRDRGATWSKVVPTIDGDDGPVLNAAMGSLAMDPRSHRLFASSMGDPSCPVEGPWAEKIAQLIRRRETWSSTLAFSDDLGERWTVVRGQFRDGGDWGKTFVGVPALDSTRRALSASGYPSVVYHCAGATFSTTSYCWKSLDGGATFRLTRSPVFSDYTGRTPLPYGGEPAGPDDPSRNDRHTLSGVGTVTADGTLYIPANINGHARIYISRDEGDSWTHVAIPGAHVRAKKTYGPIRGFQEPPNGGRPHKPQQPFHALYGSTAMSALWSEQLAVDAEGTLYLSWVDAMDDLPYLAISRDGARSWSAPRMVAPPGVDMASTSAIAVRQPGEVAIAYYASRDAGETFDGMLTVSYDALAQEPRLESAHTAPDEPIQPNRVGEPVEYVGVDFAPDGSVWASYARDTCRLDPSRPDRQCDGNFEYNGDRFRAVVMHLERSPAARPG